MKCFTVYRHPGGAIKCEPGISVVRTFHFNGRPCVRLGMNGYLSCENIIELGTGKRAPAIHDWRNDLQVIYDAFPVETSAGSISHRWTLCRPARDDDSVSLVRLNFGAQVPEQCRCDVFPESGSSSPVGIAFAAVNKRPWPSFCIDGIWIVSVGDVFCARPVQKPGIRLVMGPDGMEMEQ